MPGVCDTHPPGQMESGAVLNVPLSTQLEEGKWVALDEGGWFLQQEQGRKRSASVLSPALEMALGASTNGKGSCGIGFRDKADAEVYTEAAAYQAPPFLLPSSPFPNHLLQLFLWGPVQG